MPQVDSTTKQASLAISVIMPVYNGMDFISRSLPPLVSMLQRGDLLEVIVVDDGSTDGTEEEALRIGATVISSGGRLGPAGARNEAARTACGDILWFVDADVIVHDDAAQGLLSGFSDPAVVAVFGSYDDHPPAQNFFSRYKNLVHHYYHQHAREEAGTFWSGCGAIRRQVFLDSGGFDVERYRYPSIEDIELGHRLLFAGGRIRLCRDVQCTHLKIWGFGNLIHTEIFRRAIPWSRLILESGAIPDDLNVGLAERGRASVAVLLVLLLLAALAGLPAWPALAIVFLVMLVINRDVAGFFFHRGGFLFALRGLLFHQVYYFYSASAFAWVLLERILQGLLGRSSARGV